MGITASPIAAAAAVYRDTLGGDVTEAVAQPDHGVTTVFINLPNTKIELLEPLGAGSPIAKFSGPVTTDQIVAKVSAAKSGPCADGQCGPGGCGPKK